jgi:phospholipase C
MLRTVLRHRAFRLITLAFTAVTLTAGMSGPTAIASPASALTFPSMCGNSGTAPLVKHVILVMMENASYNQIVGSANAPYQTSLTKSCGVALDYFGATHTSAANYLAVSAGEYPAASPPGCGSVKACTDNSPNLYNQLSTAGDTWAGFMEAMPSSCDPKSVTGSYKIGHNPILFYPDDASRCPADDIAIPSLTATSGPFYTDLQNQTLPSFSWVTPGEANDGEGSGTKAQEIQAADTFLSKFVPLVTSSPSYQAGTTLLLITYDEGSGSDSTVGEDCTNKSLDLPVTSGVSAHQDSCHVPLFVVYPYTRAGATNSNFFDHYSITRTVEKMFGLTFLAHAGDAQTLALVNEFGIPSP